MTNPFRQVLSRFKAMFKRKSSHRPKTINDVLNLSNIYGEFSQDKIVLFKNLYERLVINPEYFPGSQIIINEQDRGDVCFQLGSEKIELDGHGLI